MLDDRRREVKPMNDIEILENCWLMKTNHVLDEENKKVRQSIENLIQENKELRIQISARETVVDKLTKENKELKQDIEEMYYKGVVLDILQDTLNISRDEAIKILEGY